MSDEALISFWKNAGAGDAAADSHPAGAIRVAGPSAIGRRARLLSGATSMDGAYSPEWISVTSLSQN
ncbi:hypothetical protein GXW82_00360 [Streptacidiphilus sp. 4-A2]|nr:hypothetical protein [Streptacidiphilus sp. 4-A2]